MARNEQLIRQHRILQILERHRFGVTLEALRDALVDELGLSSLHTRSVRRDLAALQVAGIDVDVHDSPQGRVWKLGDRFRGAHSITASATELIALSLGRDLLLPLAGTPFWMGIESFWSKIQDSLPEAVWNHYQRYRRGLQVMGVPAKSYAPHQGMIKTIHRGVLEHRVLSIHYQSLVDSSPAERRIAPYGIVFYQGSLYIVAEAVDARGNGELKHYKLDRFQRAEILDEWFEPRDGFDLEAYLHGSIGMFSGGEARTYRIRVRPYAVPWIQEQPWHPEQQLEPQTDGSMVLTLQASHDMEIIPRVLAMGNEVELLEPDSCRRALADIVRQMAETYAASGDVESDAA